MLYRILTENLNRKRIERIISKSFKGFSLIKSQGFWEGIKENSLIIEISGSKKIAGKVKVSALEIKKANKQDAVLIQVFSDNSFLV